MKTGKVMKSSKPAFATASKKALVSVPGQPKKGKEQTMPTGNGNFNPQKGPRPKKA